MIRNALSSDSKIRISIAGCVRISTKHFDSNGSYADQFELALVCDSDKAPSKKRN